MSPFLRFLVHAQDKRLIRRIKVKPHHIGQFFHKALVPGQLEGPNPMGLKTMRIPDSGHGGRTDPLSVGHRPDRPMRRPGGFCLQRGLHNLMNLLGTQSPLARPFRSFLGQAQNPVLFKPLPPKQYSRTGCLQPLRHCIIGHPSRCKQANPSTKSHPLRCVPSPNPGLQSSLLLQGHRQCFCRFPHETHYAAD